MKTVAEIPHIQRDAEIAADELLSGESADLMTRESARALIAQAYIRGFDCAWQLAELQLRKRLYADATPPNRLSLDRHEDTVEKVAGVLEVIDAAVDGMAEQPMPDRMAHGISNMLLMTREALQAHGQPAKPPTEPE